jgi:16S rRNA (guanine527-N7)-methyltransferase
VGPGEIGPQIAHSEGFAQCWEEVHPAPPGVFLDLGSGGGLPGLVLLERWNSPGILVDSMKKRMKLLGEVLAWPDAPTGGQLILGRVEEIAREPELSGTIDLVTARAFGSPAVTAECAARFLKIGGMLLVSEPPDDSQPSRWNTEILTTLGLETRGRVRHGAAFQVLVKTHPTPKQYPRDTGVPGKSPLF